MWSDIMLLSLLAVLMIGVIIYLADTAVYWHNLIEQETESGDDNVDY